VSTTTIGLTCRCGARLSLDISTTDSMYVLVANERRAFDEAHAACRATEPTSAIASAIEGDCTSSSAGFDFVHDDLPTFHRRDLGGDE